MSEETVQAAESAAERYTRAQQAVTETLSDPEASAGSLTSAARQAEMARAGYEAAVERHQAEAEAGA